MATLLKHLVPRVVRRRVLDLSPRLDQLEASVRSLTAVVDVLLSPAYVAADDVGFNGQLARKRIFADILAAIPFDAIAETGTWVGNTAGYMAETSGLPVYSCDIDRRFHRAAQMRLAGMDNVRLSLQDSREFLRELSSGPLAEKTVFFYLDAHWHDDAPLQEEVDWIATHWASFVIMIDDFQVPTDPGYEYDGCGRDWALTLDLLRQVIGLRHLVPLFPAAHSSEETGRRRGCVVLVPDALTDRLSEISSLRALNPI